MGGEGGDNKKLRLLRGARAPGYDTAAFVATHSQAGRGQSRLKTPKAQRATVTDRH